MEKKLPNEVLSKSINLNKFGKVGLAFLKNDLIQIIEKGFLDRYAILGGDVLILDKQRKVTKFTNDSWFTTDRDKKESFEEYCGRCKNTSLLYLKKYKSDDEVIFLPIISSEITAGF